MTYILLPFIILSLCTNKAPYSFPIRFISISRVYKPFVSSCTPSHSSHRERSHRSLNPLVSISSSKRSTYSQLSHFHQAIFIPTNSHSAFVTHTEFEIYSVRAMQ
ncbi:hypothetical protein BJ138DRAFT_1168130 [Hygrophoropsis aurantiaca]|uniref:Uncharacterized protein n=1 Tax=Hygrophoropsis aurantiaca TaxID=72124 RepID=A0ACB7ZRC0_9AGAM|nr:hypothetical protein BJ138DRAFT_1168130 [Hygrophoropsis aurantiaca]